MTDLWPELNLENVRTPLAILKEQAAALAAKTNNIVTAKIGATPGDPKWFTYTFYIAAPELKNYRYELFSIAFDANLYPVKFLIDDEDLIDNIQGQVLASPEFVSKDEQEYLTFLKQIFSSERTQSIIKTLYSQSMDLRQTA